jgi:hypothetical protein
LGSRLRRRTHWLASGNGRQDPKNNVLIGCVFDGGAPAIKMMAVSGEGYQFSDTRKEYY